MPRDHLVVVRLSDAEYRALQTCKTFTREGASALIRAGLRGQIIGIKKHFDLLPEDVRLQHPDMVALRDNEV